MQETQDEAMQALTKHFDALAKLERDFPDLCRCGYRIASVLENFCRFKQLNENDINFGSIKWFGDGTIVFEVLSGDKPPDFSSNAKAESFNNLKKLDAEFPQVVSMLFAIGAKLVSYVNNRRIMPDKLGFSAPMLFEIQRNDKALPDDVNVIKRAQRFAIRFKINHGKNGLPSYQVNL